MNNGSFINESFGLKNEVVPEKIYGSFKDKTARVYYPVESTTHPGEHLSKKAIGKAVGFVQKAMPADNPIPTSNQQVGKVSMQAIF